ncbi:SusC/RagA family TonB-linked outer membrane protein [Spirosoma sp. BT702]|uniref:SusC/RagA family TonB-linked outer membrane protein n=1 Tax=Spirosoma profusum TaxID=2771354 RepID=A0A927AWI7_9BACT|nr:SusC/RagA family TonB-linked outer membrane protein [Spirosoma profusum]MBD2705735.1 SusC/RagA family TonB-linked outer membrane protein [Spirosoma profusum]
MKKTLLQLSLLTISCTGLPLSSFSQTFASAQVVQRQANRNVQTQLKNVLLDLQRHYRVEIVFEDRIMVGKNVSSDVMNLNVSLEKNLNHLLKNTGLRARKIRKDTYVIIEAPREKADVSVRKEDPVESSSAPVTSDGQTVLNVPEPPVTRQPDVADIGISGTVIDEAGAGLPGVSVVVKGTTRGTTTDSKGFYQLNVPNEQAVLVFSFVGYLPQETTVGNRTMIGIKLENDTKSLSEVVVVGYGTQKKVNVTGAVSTISSEDIVRRPVGQTSSALQGMMPGVTVTQRSGRPGGDAGSIRIRGVGTIGNPDPLVLIDNIEGSMNSIDPNLIESITVLKDAASASIYGSRAANGVILVTTKRAKANRISMNYNNYIGWQTPTNLPKMANAIDHMLLTNEAYVNVGRSPLYSDDLIQKYRTLGATNRDLYPDTDWQREVLTGSGLQQSHFFSINGGSEKIRFLTSVGYLDQKGVIENSGFRRYTLRNNTDIQISKKFSARADLQIVAATTTEPGRGGQLGEGSEYVFHWMNRIPANQLGINSNGSWGEGWNGDNPIAVARDGGTRKNNSPYAMLNAALVYKPIEGLTAEIAYSPKYALSIDKTFAKMVQTFKPDGTPSFLSPAKSSLTEVSNRSLYTTLRGTLTYEKVFGEHGLKILGGFSREDFRNDNVTGYREGFLLPDYQVLNAGASDIQRASGGASEWALQSAFGRINYDYKQKYLFEANARYDGSSRFAKGRKYGFFPSVSAGWRISQEAFMQPLLGTLNELKFRASWGQLGNQNIQGGNYPFMSSLQFGPYTLGKQIVNVVALNTLANSEISWETTEMTDFGIDATLFSNLSITADYYYKQTRDILLDLDIPAIIGLGKPYQNAGVVENKGWELGLNYKGAIRDFRYDIGFNISDVKNKIVDLRGVNTISLQANREGYPIQSLYGLQAEGLFQTVDEVASHAQQFGVIKPGDIKYKDQNGDGIINGDDNVVLGSTIPRFTYGTTLNAYYKGFSLNVVLQGVGKADGLLNEQGIMPFFLGGTVQEQHKDHWTPENPNATFPRLAFSEANNEKNSSFWLRNAAYLRLKNIQLGYTIPTTLTQRIGINNIRVFANGQNILTFDKFWDGYDVESPVGTGRSYPQVKMYSFGIDVNF